MTRLHRLARRLGPTELARRVGVSVATVRRWLREGVPRERAPELRSVEERSRRARRAALTRSVAKRGTLPQRPEPSGVSLTPREREQIADQRRLAELELARLGALRERDELRATLERERAERQTERASLRDELRDLIRSELERERVERPPAPAPPEAPPEPPRVERLRAELAELTPEERRELELPTPAAERPRIPEAVTDEEFRLLSLARDAPSGGRPVTDVRFENGQLVARDSFGRPLRGYAVINTQTGATRVYWTDRAAFEAPSAAISSEYESLRPRRYVVRSTWRAAS